MVDDFDPQHHSKNSLFYSSDIDSGCSTPYVSAPSSPGRHSSAANTNATGGFFYSAPTSPMHYLLSASFVKPSFPETSNTKENSNSFEFDFSGDPIPTIGSMSSADELFLNGQIRPMKLKSHLQRPQKLAPLIDLEETETEGGRGREAKSRDRRRARSMSPLRNSMNWHKISKDSEKCEIKEVEEEEEGEEEDEETVATMSASSSRSSSGGRSSKRWIFLKEFLYRSKSEGRNNINNNNSSSSSNNKFWNNFSAKVKKAEKCPPIKDNEASVSSLKESVGGPSVKKKAGPTNGVGKRRVPASAHEMHYKANRAQAEEMRKKTFLPYRQGLIGCLGFSSKSYGAVNGLARALNPVSSR